MSHWTKVKTKIMDLDILKQAIETTGCVFTEQKTFSSTYAGTLNCVGAISAEGHTVSNSHGAAITHKDKNGYHIVMDNYGNSLKDVAGESCGKITQKYSELVTQDAMVNAGYMQENSWVEDGGDLLMEFVG